MGNIIVDETKSLLSESELESKCPDCGSRVLFCSYERIFRVNLDTEGAEETIDSGIDPVNVWCKCGWQLYDTSEEKEE